MLTQYLSALFLSLILITKAQTVQKCPQLRTYDNSKKDQNFYVKNVLRIPKTNILVINTSEWQNPISSIVYYYDMSSSSGEVVNVIARIYSYYLSDNTQNIVYDLSFSNGSYSHTLIINSQFYVFPIYLSADDDYTIMSISSYYWIQITCYFKLQYQQSSVQNAYSLKFDGGFIQNIQGVQDNYFISLQSSEIQFFNIIQKNDELFIFKSDSLPHTIYQSKSNKQQSTLIKLTNSQAQFSNCTISNLSIKNLDSNVPLLIQSQNSTVQLFNSSISNCSYVKSQPSNRILSEIKEIQPSKDLTSLMMLQNIQIQIQNGCIFSELNCQTCNGVIQMQNGTFNIDNSIFNQARSQFGGFFFIYGLQGKNSISNSIFYKCQSQFDGGAMYIHSQYTNVFQLLIEKSIFQNNTSINGKGGAIFIYSDNLNPPNSSAQISESNFVSNFAQIAGAIFQQNISTQLVKTQFEGNIGQIYGSNLVSYASKLNLVNLQEFLNQNKGKQSEFIEIMDFRSGGSLKNIQFQLINEQNDVIIPVTYEEIQSYKIQVQINPHTQNINSYQLSGDEQVNFNQTSNSFYFSQLTINSYEYQKQGNQLSSRKFTLSTEQISQYKLNYQKCIFELPQSVGNPIKQTMSSLDCLLVKVETDIPIIFFRMIFSQIIPIFYLIIFFTGLLIYHYGVSKKKEPFPIQSISTASMFLIIYSQPDLVAQIIALLSCRNVGDKSYILSNVSFECYTSQHIKYILTIAVPLLIIWLLLLPATLFFLLKKNQNQLEDTQIKLKYGFLYIEYKNSAFYWEFVKMAEKITIILSLNFYSQMIIIKGILVFLSITIYGILAIMVKPYKEEEINQIDKNSTLVCSITVLLGIFIYQNPFPYFYYPSFGIILLVNSAFILSVLKEIILNYYLIIKQIVKNLIIKLSVKIHLLKRFTQAETNTKKLNPEIKAKIKRAFQRYLDMNFEQRKQFFIKVLETQLSKISIKYKFKLKISYQQYRHEVSKCVKQIIKLKKLAHRTKFKQFRQ
ncbi:hypothetical protein ABPG72_015915 [Tetrahymena utriculariae]